MEFKHIFKIDSYMVNSVTDGRYENTDEVQTTLEVTMEVDENAEAVTLSVSHVDAVSLEYRGTPKDAEDDTTTDESLTVDMETWKVNYTTDRMRESPSCTICIETIEVNIDNKTVDITFTY